MIIPPRTLLRAKGGFGEIWVLNTKAGITEVTLRVSWETGMITCKSLVPGKAFGIGIIISDV